MKKIAIIDTLGAHGGAFHFYTFGQSIGLINSGIDVSLYTNNETFDPKINGLNFFSFYENIFSSKSKIINGIQWVIGSIKSILHARFSGISVFHFHIFYTNILVLLNVLLVKLLFGKVVLTIHDVTSFSSNKDSPYINSLMYKLTDLILTHNQFSKDEVVKMNGSLKGIIHIVPHGNYTPFITLQKDKKKSREYLALPKNKKILLFFGMIKKVKGLDVLLESLAKVVVLDSDIVLLIAGSPWENDFESSEEIIRDRNLSKHIILHKRFISHDDVEHYYCASDLVVLPYKQIYQSGVLMMALSYGKPVLASDLEPFKEVITDNKDGFIFKSEDTDDLTKKISVILSDKTNLERVQQNGKTLINMKFGWDAIGRLTKMAYQTL